MLPVVDCETFQIACPVLGKDDERRMVSGKKKVIQKNTSRPPIPFGEGPYVFKSGMQIGASAKQIRTAVAVYFLHQLVKLLLHFAGGSPNLLETCDIVMLLKGAGPLAICRIERFIICTAGQNPVDVQKKTGIHIVPGQNFFP